MQRKISTACCKPQPCNPLYNKHVPSFALPMILQNVLSNKMLGCNTPAVASAALQKLCQATERKIKQELAHWLPLHKGQVQEASQCC